MEEKPKEVLYTHQKKHIQCSSLESTEPGYVTIKELAEAMCRYDLDDMDLHWLQALNRELDRMGKGPRRVPAAYPGGGLVAPLPRLKLHPLTNVHVTPTT